MAEGAANRIKFHAAESTPKRRRAGRSDQRNDLHHPVVVEFSGTKTLSFLSYVTVPIKFRSPKAIEIWIPSPCGAVLSDISNNVNLSAALDKRAALKSEALKAAIGKR
jgi:hypothetical protein